VPIERWKRASVVDEVLLESSMNHSPETLAIVGATIIDGNGGTPIRDGVVVVEGARILAVGDRSTVIPPQAKQIVASGKFVIPGLMSTHSFLVDGTVLPTLVRYEGRFDEVAIESAQLALKGGVTTMFSDWGPRDALIKAREAIKQGQVVASRIYLAGNVVGYGGPFSDDFRPGHKEGMPAPFVARIDAQWEFNVGRSLVRMAPEQVREEVRQYVYSGIDFLSCAITDHCCTGGACQYLVFSLRVLQLIVDEAHRAGLPVYGFSPFSNEGLVQALNAGVDHTVVCSALPYISDETVALAGQRRLPCAVSGHTAEVREWYRERGMKGEVTINAMVQRLLEAGAVPLLQSTGGASSEDEINSWTHIPPIKGAITVGEAHIYYLQAMQENGVTAMGALLAATRNVAKAYKVDKDLGTLERGKLADLLVLDKDPLEDAENYRTINVVMKEGKIVDRGALPTQRLITAPLPKVDARAERRSA
jgi:imidazolonepropionase-like amidohydrolase